MDLLEHQGKRLFAAAGLPVPEGRVVDAPAAAEAAARELGGTVAVKAQVRSGGRGKAGGVRLCRTPPEAAAAARDLLGLTVRGHAVEALLVERALDVAHELYLAVTLSRAERAPLLVFSRRGGVDVEELAREDPAALLRQRIDPLLGLLDYQVRDVVAAAGLAGEEARRALAAVVRGLARLCHDRDATLVEVNPLAVTAAGEVVCLDAKVTVDDNALWRQPEVQALTGAGPEPGGPTFVPLEGEVGVIGNGAGLVMSVIDQVALAGAAAADFCDIGGGARAEVVAVALRRVLTERAPRVVLVAIFGGITRGEEVARGLIAALRETRPKVPVVVRLEGNGAEEGRRLLAAAGLPGVSVVADLGEAVRRAVAAARDGGSG